jgi:hypothetical protein
MPDPQGLLAVARLLLDETTAPASDSQLRRAASTVYYALFHKILRSAAERFAGPGKDSSAAYGLIYRSFDHGRMKEVCLKLGKRPLNETLRRQLRCDMIGQDMRDFANAFPGVQEFRHLADYDPAAVFEVADVQDLIETVEFAIAAFDRAKPPEQADILALFMVKPRS